MLPEPTPSASLTRLRVTDAVGRSVNLNVPPTDLDMIVGPALRMRLYHDAQGEAHIEYDAAVDQPPSEVSAPNDPLHDYHVGNITVKRAGRVDLTFKAPQDLADNVPLDLTRGVILRTYLSPDSRPIGPLLNVVIDQSY
jgi:hypothetical protein